MPSFDEAKALYGSPKAATRSRGGGPGSCTTAILDGSVSAIGRAAPSAVFSPKATSEEETSKYHPGSHLRQVLLQYHDELRTSLYQVALLKESRRFQVSLCSVASALLQLAASSKQSLFDAKLDSLHYLFLDHKQACRSVEQLQESQQLVRALNGKLQAQESLQELQRHQQKATVEAEWMAKSASYEYRLEARQYEVDQLKMQLADFRAAAATWEKRQSLEEMRRADMAAAHDAAVQNYLVELQALKVAYREMTEHWLSAQVLYDVLKANLLSPTLSCHDTLIDSSNVSIAGPLTFTDLLEQQRSTTTPASAEDKWQFSASESVAKKITAAQQIPPRIIPPSEWRGGTTHLSNSSTASSGHNPLTADEETTCDSVVEEKLGYQDSSGASAAAAIRPTSKPYGDARAALTEKLTLMEQQAASLVRLEYPRFFHPTTAEEV